MFDMLIGVFAVVLIISTAKTQECQKRDYGNGGYVCVCSSAYCDVVPKPNPVVPPSYYIYTSNKAGLRFQKIQGTFGDTNEISNNQIYVNSNEQYQEIFGWGGAFTDATGINVASLDKQAQENFLKSYFSDDGIEYSLCRVPMGGTDFSTHLYSYDDGNEDVKLANFKLAPEDFKYKIPLIKKALDLAKNNLRLFTSVWVAPKWMKTKEGFLGAIREDKYQTWAEYFIKFFDRYKEQGITFWGMTTQNEITLALVPPQFREVPSNLWTPKTMAKWIGNNLGPTIRNSSYSDIKIMTLDDQRFLLPWFVDQTLEDENVRNYIDGIAVHWYWDFLFSSKRLKDTHDHFPEKFILATEACHGDKPFQKHVDLGAWDRGEAYADDIIQDVLNWVTGWVDWNMALDLQGGPTFINNFVDSPVIVNSTAGEFYKQPMFYALGHFSKFVPRGSIRIGSYSFCEKIAIAAFKRLDNGTAVVILNKRTSVVPVTLSDNSRGSTKLNLSAKSITTLLYW